MRNENERALITKFLFQPTTIFFVLLLLTPIFFSISAESVSAQTTQEACRETGKVLKQLESEVSEAEETWRLKVLESYLRTYLSSLNKIITRKTVASINELEYIANILLKVEIPQDLSMRNVEERRPFQLKLRSDLQRAIQRVANISVEDATQARDRIDHQIGIRKLRMTSLGCGSVAYGGDGGSSQNWAGAWVESHGYGETANISGGGSSISATFNYAGGDFKGSGSWTGCTVAGTTVDCSWSAEHTDSTKSGTRSGKIHLTLSGDSISGTMTENEPKWSYKPGYSKQNVDSSMVAGKEWPLTYKRK